jgi:hypothetical protein
MLSHFLDAQVVWLAHAVQRHLVGFQNDPVTRPHVGRQGTRVPIQIVAAQFSSVFLFDHGNLRFGNNFMRHAHHDAVGDLLVQCADMRFHIAGVYLVSERLDHPLVPPDQMQARGSVCVSNYQVRQ